MFPALPGAAQAPALVLATRARGCPRPRTEIRAPTGLRIVAAVWAVLFHFGGELVPLVEQIPPLAAIVGGGGIGVELFFVLSGFVIARSYLDECGRGWSTGRAARFVLNRFARVWPAFAVVTVAVCVWWFVGPRIGLGSEFVSGTSPSSCRPCSAS